MYDLGIAENGLFGITVYPNPTTGIIKIDLDESLYTVQRIELTDMVGRQLWNVQTYTGQIDLNSMAGGAYLLRIITGSGTHVERILITR